MASDPRIDPRPALAAAHNAAADAEKARRRLRRRTVPGGYEREREIEWHLRALAEAMKPIRSLMGHLAFDNVQRPVEVRQASRRLQYERHALRRMRRPRAA